MNYPMEYTIYNMKPKELQAWREEHRYTQSKLARVLGVTSLTVSRWETEARKTSPYLHLALEYISIKEKEKSKRR